MGSAFLILSSSVLLFVCSASPVVRVVNEHDSENSLPHDVIYRYDRDGNLHLLTDSSAPIILTTIANGTSNFRIKRGSYYPYQPYGYEYSYSTRRGYGSGYGYGTRYGGYGGCYNCYYPRPGRRLRAGLLIGGAAFTGGLLGSRIG